MERLAFKMRLFPGHAQEYKKRHDEIWPELVKLLRENGISDYSIFLDGETNSLIGVLKIESKEKFDQLPVDKIMQKWWKYMSDIMLTHADNAPVSIPLQELFYLR